MTYANSLDRDQAPQNVGPDLRSKLFDTRLIVYFCKNQDGTIHVAKIMHTTIHLTKITYTVKPVYSGHSLNRYELIQMQVVA